MFESLCVDNQPAKSPIPMLWISFFTVCWLPYTHVRNHEAIPSFSPCTNVFYKQEIIITANVVHIHQRPKARPLDNSNDLM